MDARRATSPPQSSTLDAVGKGGTGIRCWVCGGGHFLRDCPIAFPEQKEAASRKGQQPTSGGWQTVPGKKGTKGGKGSKGGGKARGTLLCRAFLRDGQCNKPNCPYVHAKVPKPLAAISDLVLEDLGACVVDNDGVHHPQDPSKLDAGRIFADVQAWLGSIGGLDSSASGEGQPDPGFPGQAVQP